MAIDGELCFALPTVRAAKIVSLSQGWVGRCILGRSSATEIMALDENGTQVSKYHPGARYGLYVRPSERKQDLWQLHGEFDRLSQVESAAARYRRNLRGELR